MNTSMPRMFSSIWNETSVSAKRWSRAWPIGTHRNSAISCASSGWALPEKSLSSVSCHAVRHPGDLFRCACSDVHDGGSGCGWGGRIRTFECGSQSPVPYHLATPHHARLHSAHTFRRRSSALADAPQSRSTAVSPKSPRPTRRGLPKGAVYRRDPTSRRKPIAYTYLPRRASLGCRIWLCRPTGIAALRRGRSRTCCGGFGGVSRGLLALALALGGRRALAGCGSSPAQPTPTPTAAAGGHSTRLDAPHHLRLQRRRTA